MRRLEIDGEKEEEMRGEKTDLETALSVSNVSNSQGLDEDMETVHEEVSKEGSLETEIMDQFISRTSKKRENEADLHDEIS